MTESVGDYIRLTRLIRAPREDVYNAWLDSAVRKQWWCADPSMHCGVCEIDASLGGAYRVGMVSPDGQEHVVVGRFVTLEPPSKLVFTWTWETNPGFGADSVVSIELFKAEFEGEPATELLLMHEKLARPIERSDHTWGWLGCIRSLGRLFADRAEAAKQSG